MHRATAAKALGTLAEKFGESNFPESTSSSILSKGPCPPQSLLAPVIKSLTDPTSATVRVRAAAASSILISLQSRVDPLVTELPNRCDPTVLVESPQLFIQTSHVQEIANSALVAIPNAIESSSTTAAVVVGKMITSKAYQLDQELMGEVIKKLAVHLTLETNIESKHLILVCLRALQKDDGVYQTYSGMIDTAASKALIDYHRRILSKLAINERARIENLHGQEDAEVYAVGGIVFGAKDDE
ncbi:hypothetical protein BG005_006657 [Podila minutissima]|nr:hypothetical protein BG005_006657 [Podila minutissima]